MEEGISEYGARPFSNVSLKKLYIFFAPKRGKNPKIDSFTVLAKWRESQISPVRAFQIRAKKTCFLKTWI